MHAWAYELPLDREELVGDPLWVVPEAPRAPHHRYPPREVSDAFEGALPLLHNFDLQELLRAQTARSSASMIARNCTTGRSEVYS